jgi:hypothetical protein
MVKMSEENTSEQKKPVNAFGSIGIGISMNANLVYSPEKELQILSKLAEQGDHVDWKPAIILASTYLEKYGIEKLKQFFTDKKITLAGRFENMSLSDVEVFLYGLNLLPEKYFTWIDQVWHERCNIIHQKGELPSYVGNEANKKYGGMLDRSLEVLQYLKKTNK